MAELGNRLSSRELAEWMAYYRIEPWGEERADYRAGTVAATVVNVNRTKGKPAKPDDFMPKFGVKHAPAPEATERQMIAADVRSVFSALKRKANG